MIAVVTIATLALAAIALCCVLWEVASTINAQDAMIAELKRGRTQDAEALAAERHRADALGMAVVECHRTIDELEQIVTAHEKVQREKLGRSVLRLPVLDAPSGKICLN